MFEATFENVWATDLTALVLNFETAFFIVSLIVFVDSRTIFYPTKIYRHFSTDIFPPDKFPPGGDIFLPRHFPTRTFFYQDFFEDDVP